MYNYLPPFYQHLPTYNTPSRGTLSNLTSLAWDNQVKPAALQSFLEKKRAFSFQSTK